METETKPKRIKKNRTECTRRQVNNSREGKMYKHAEFNSFSISKIKTPFSKEIRKKFGMFAGNGNGICLVFTRKYPSHIQLSVHLKMYRKQKAYGGRTKNKKDKAKTYVIKITEMPVYFCCLQMNGNATVWHGKCAMEAKITKHTLLLEINETNSSNSKIHTMWVCVFCTDTINTKQFVFHFDLLFFSIAWNLSMRWSRFVVWCVSF